jgi:GTP pyrophosphokinase
VRAWFRKLEAGAPPASATVGATPPPASAKVQRAVAPRAKSHGNSGIEIEGVGELPTTLARCCGPARPQAIMGYVTLVRGVTIHRGDCASLARMRALKPERVLKVEWSADAAAPGARVR